MYGNKCLIITLRYKNYDMKMIILLTWDETSDADLQFGIIVYCLVYIDHFAILNQEFIEF